MRTGVRTLFNACMKLVVEWMSCFNPNCWNVSFRVRRKSENWVWLSGTIRLGSLNCESLSGKALTIGFGFPKCSSRLFNAGTYRLLLQPYPSITDFASPVYSDWRCIIFSDNDISERSVVAWKMLNQFIQSSRLPSDFVACNLNTDFWKQLDTEMGFWYEAEPSVADVDGSENCWFGRNIHDELLFTIWNEVSWLTEILFE